MRPQADPLSDTGTGPRDRATVAGAGSPCGTGLRVGVDQPGNGSPLAALWGYINIFKGRERPRMESVTGQVDPCLDLDQRAEWQLVDGDRRPSRWLVAEDIRVLLVHDREVIHADEEDIGLDHVGQPGAVRLHDLAQVGQRLRRLRSHPSV